MYGVQRISRGKFRSLRLDVKALRGTGRKLVKGDIWGSSPIINGSDVLPGVLAQPVRVHDTGEKRLALSLLHGKPGQNGESA